MSQPPFTGDPAADRRARIETYLRRRGLDPAAVRVAALAGDASTRVYLRVSAPGRQPWLLAAHPEPFTPEELPQIVVGRLLDRLGIPIPRVLDHAGDLGLLALEDLGDETLQRRLAAAPTEGAALYRDAVALIARLQRGGAEQADPTPLPFTRAFDVAKLAWELDFFCSEFLAAYRGIHLDAARAGALQAELRGVATELAAQPRVLCHRDFHARNLMVRRGALVVIDFQDARLGPATYDLVSLVRDCYVDLPPALVEASVRRFLTLLPEQDTGDFPARCDLMAVQRHLKALGTFGHQVAVANRPGFAEPIPRTLGYLRRVLHARPRFGRLLELLRPHLPELR